MATSLGYERWRDAMDINMHHARSQSFQNQQAMGQMGDIADLAGGVLSPGSYYQTAGSVNGEEKTIKEELQAETDEWLKGID